MVLVEFYDARTQPQRAQEIGLSRNGLQGGERKGNGGTKRKRKKRGEAKVMKETREKN